MGINISNRIREIIDEELNNFNSLNNRESLDLAELRDKLLIKVFEAFMENGKNHDYQVS